MIAIAKSTIPAVGASITLGLLLAGCATTPFAPPPAPAVEKTEAPAPTMAAIERTEMTFSLAKCRQIDVNLYKCPAVDKPICSPYYNGDLTCVRVGKKGNVFVMPGMETE